MLAKISSGISSILMPIFSLESEIPGLWMIVDVLLLDDGEEKGKHAWGQRVNARSADYPSLVPIVLIASYPCQWLLDIDTM